MNHYGIIEPIYDAPAKPTWADRVRGWAQAHRNFLLVVVVPTLLTAAYLYLIASDQYVSEVHFLVKKSGQEPTPGIGVSQALSMATGISSAQSEQMSVADYLTSHDAVDTLRRESRLVERFHRSYADPFSRLWSANPTPETLLKYYRGKVQVHYNTETGITELTVRSFQPNDSYDIAKKLVEMGEQRVNYMNMRSYEDAVSQAKRQLADAENEVVTLQSRMTRFRQSRSDIDPKSSGQAQIMLVSTLTTQLAGARAQLAAMGNTINHSSPQYLAMARRVAALEGQIAHQSSKLTGGDGTIAEDLGGYEDLKVRQDFVAKRYDAAASALESARAQAARQQLYVVRVVDANLPVKSTYPVRFRTLATVVLTLLLAYAIGWLIAAGVREHAA
jgi:capsular polysaccharide transport system permease protein